jgi:hypothetical protein
MLWVDARIPVENFADHVVLFCQARKGAPMAPSRDEQNALHELVLRGDPTATAQVVQLLQGELVRRLRHKWPNNDVRDLDEQALDSLFNYFQAPQRYDPKRSSLLHYLVLDAHGDLINTYNRSNRLQEIPTEDVAERRASRNNETGEEFEGDDETDERRLDALLDESFPDQADRRIVELMRDGIRPNRPYAAVLGISHLSADQQDREVKRVKDRIKKKLRRLIARQL